MLGTEFNFSRLSIFCSILHVLEQDFDHVLLDYFLRIRKRSFHLIISVDAVLSIELYFFPSKEELVCRLYRTETFFGW